MSAVRFSALAGQADRFMRFFTPGTASATDNAPVGFGPAAGMPPKAAQVPTAIVAAAPPQTSRAMSSADLPPIVQYAPSAPVGIDPSTKATYLPEFLCTVSASASSAWLPAAAIIVS